MDTKANFARILIESPFVGNSAIQSGGGASSLFLRFCYDEFPEVCEQFPSRTRCSKLVTALDGQQWTLDIDASNDHLVCDWEDHSHFNDAHLEARAAADGYMIVFDITSRLDLNDVESWYRSFCRLHDDARSVPFVLVGNKTDRAAERVCSSEDRAAEVAALARTLGAPLAYCETSAKENVGVTQAFLACISAIQACRERGDARAVPRKLAASKPAARPCQIA